MPVPVVPAHAICKDSRCPDSIAYGLHIHLDMSGNYGERIVTMAVPSSPPNVCHGCDAVDESRPQDHYDEWQGPYRLTHLEEFTFPDNEAVVHPGVAWLHACGAWTVVS